MKCILLIMFSTLLFTGCIDVIRGYKSVTYIRNEGDRVKFSPGAPKIQVAADKEYSDSFKTNADASQNKQVPSQVDKEIK